MANCNAGAGDFPYLPYPLAGGLKVLLKLGDGSFGKVYKIELATGGFLAGKLTPRRDFVTGEKLSVRRFRRGLRNVPHIIFYSTTALAPINS